jgi:hypothetical protein
MPHRPAAMRAQRPGRIILRLVAPGLQNLRLALVELRIDQLLHLAHRLQRRGSLRDNSLTHPIQDLLNLLIHLLAIHWHTPRKPLIMDSPPPIPSVPNLAQNCHRIPTAPPQAAAGGLIHVAGNNRHGYDEDRFAEDR